MRIGKTLIAAMAAAGLSGGLGCEEQPQQPGGGGQDTGQPPATQPSSPDQDQGMDRQQPGSGQQQQQQPEQGTDGGNY